MQTRSGIHTERAAYRQQLAPVVETYQNEKARILGNV